jgi:hypothetical protein
MRLMYLMTAATVLFAACSNLNFKRTYSLGYQGASVSATFEPGKQIMPLDGLPDEPQRYKQTYDRVHGVNFGVPPGWEGKMDQWEKAGRPPFSPEDVPANYGK